MTLHQFLIWACHLHHKRQTGTQKWEGDEGDTAPLLNHSCDRLKHLYHKLPKLS